MKHIIVGTNRPKSNSLKIAKHIQSVYSRLLNEEIEILDLSELPLAELDGNQYGDNKPKSLLNLTHKIDHSEGLIVIAPEYNGSMPGVLKLFIDHLSFPRAFERRPVCFVGLGGRFGGLRPVEHLQQVFGYRNAFIYPFRVFLINVWNLLKEDQITDKEVVQLLEEQCVGFDKFVKALNSQSLHANQSS